MSLNGLDDVKVKEAHDAAVAEAGGWYVNLYLLSFPRPNLPAGTLLVKYRPVANF